MLREDNLEQLLIRELDKIGIEHIKGRVNFSKGFPDRVVFDVINGVILYVELKNDTYYQLNKMQQYWRKIIINSGGYYIKTNNKDEIMDLIDKIKHKKLPKL